MKDKIDNLIENLLEKYEYNYDDFKKFIDSPPHMIFFQVAFFLYSYYNFIPESGTESYLEMIFDALVWAFGGIFVYLLISTVIFIIAACLDGRKYRIIYLIIGTICFYFAFNRLH